MKLRVDKNTSAEIIALIFADLPQEKQKELKDAAVNHFLGGQGGFMFLKVGNFCDMCEGDFSAFFKSETKAFEYLFTLAFLDFVNIFIDKLKEFKVSDFLLSQEQKAVNAALPELTFYESIFIFSQSFFRLQSFDEVQKITVFDFLLAKKAAYINEYASAIVSHQTRKAVKK